MFLEIRLIARWTRCSFKAANSIDRFSVRQFNNSVGNTKRVKFPRRQRSCFAQDCLVQQIQSQIRTTVMQIMTAFSSATPIHCCWRYFNLLMAMLVLMSAVSLRADEVRLNADFSVHTGAIRPLHGINKGCCPVHRNQK